MSDRGLAHNWSDSDEPEDTVWMFTAVGLNGATRAVRVDKLCGAVRLLTPADSSPGAGLPGVGLPPLPHAFVWNPDTRTFEPIDPDTPG